MVSVSKRPSGSLFGLSDFFGRCSDEIQKVRNLTLHPRQRSRDSRNPYFDCAEFGPGFGAGGYSTSSKKDCGSHIHLGTRGEEAFRLISAHLAVVERLIEVEDCETAYEALIQIRRCLPEPSEKQIARATKSGMVGK